jgi:histidinol-phosphate aminotransferase
MEPYVPGKPIAAVARDFGHDPSRIIKLASNENALGASPAALRALLTASTEVHRYPDNDWFALRTGLARHLDVPADQIIVGAGSSELILLAARAVLAPGRSLLISQYSFVSYEGAARSVGANVVTVPTLEWRPDTEAMRAAIDPSVKLVFIASPNNPTGALVRPDVLARFVAGVPDDVLVVLDEAYRDFVAPELRLNAHELVNRHPNVLVLRTFSKVYGLAGLRVGYGIGSAPLVALLRRLQLPFSVSTAAQSAALAALADTSFVERSVAMNQAGRAELYRALAESRIEHLPSYGSFVLVRVGTGDRVFRQLLERGIVVRPVANYGLPEWIRVTVGLPQENAAFVAALRELLPGGTPR